MSKFQLKHQQAEPNFSLSGELAMDFEIGTSVNNAQWFAVWTRSREKSSAAMLQAVGIPHFLPLKLEVRQWSELVEHRAA